MDLEVGDLIYGKFCIFWIYPILKIWIPRWNGLNAEQDKKNPGLGEDPF